MCDQNNTAKGMNGTVIVHVRVFARRTTPLFCVDIQALDVFDC